MIVCSLVHFRLYLMTVLKDIRAAVVVKATGRQVEQ
jgi:hypothetical protein